MITNVYDSYKFNKEKFEIKTLEFFNSISLNLKTKIASHTVEKNLLKLKFLKIYNEITRIFILLARLIV